MTLLDGESTRWGRSIFFSVLVMFLSYLAPSVLNARPFFLSEYFPAKIFRNTFPTFLRSIVYFCFGVAQSRSVVPVILVVQFLSSPPHFSFPSKSIKDGRVSPVDTSALDLLSQFAIFPRFFGLFLVDSFCLRFVYLIAV